MKNLKLNELSEANFQRCEKNYYPIDSKPLSFWLTAITEELGEVAKLIKRLEDGKLSEEDFKSEVGKEIADVIIYVDLLASRTKVDLNEAVIEKFNEVSDRIGSDIKIL